MNLLIRFDAWAGKTLFHPPIILLCQLTRQSQYAVHKALWFLAACHATYYAQDASWAALAFVWGYTIVLLIGATAFADVPSRSWGGFRFILWAFLMLGLVVTYFTGEFHAGQVREVIMLFAEYAATIKTLPPRRPRERKAAEMREQAQ